MKTKILKAIASLPFNVVVYAMNEYQKNTINELVDWIAFLYNAEDIERMKNDLTYLSQQ